MKSAAVLRGCALDRSFIHLQPVHHFPFTFSSRSGFNDRPNRIAIVIASGFRFIRAAMASTGSDNFESSIKRRFSFIDQGIF
jgi:hypothetical protein